MRAARRYGVGDVRRALRARGAELRAYPNVVRLTVGEKVQGRRGLGCLAIRAIVSRKQRHLPEKARLPRRIRGVEPDGSPADYTIPIDVEQGPRKLSALALRGGHRVRRVRRGSAGLTYASHSGRSLLLTNAHVVAHIGTRGIGQPVKRSRNRIGRVHRTTILRPTRANRMDASVVEIDSDVETDLLALIGESDAVAKLGRIRAGDGHEYFFVDYRGTRHRFARPEEVNHEVPIDVGGRDLLFKDFFTLKARAGSKAVPGDSGSLLVRRAGSALVACGVVFAGAERVLGVLPIERALRRLGRPSASSDGASEDVRIDFP